MAKNITIIIIFLFIPSSLNSAQENQCSFSQNWSYAASGNNHYQMLAVAGRVLRAAPRKRKRRQPLENICLALYNELNLRLISTSRTDKTGKYDFGQIPPGLYRLITETREYDPVSIPVRIYARQKDQVEKQRITLILRPGINMSYSILTDAKGNWIRGIVGF